MAVTAKTVTVVDILVAAEYLAYTQVDHFHLSMEDELLLPVIGNQTANLPRKGIVHIVDKHQTAIGGYVWGVEINTVFLVRNNFRKRKSIFS